MDGVFPKAGRAIPRDGRAALIPRDFTRTDSPCETPQSSPASPRKTRSFPPLFLRIAVVTGAVSTTVISLCNPWLQASQTLKCATAGNSYSLLLFLIISLLWSGCY